MDRSISGALVTGIGVSVIVIGTLVGVILHFAFPVWYQPTLMVTGLGLIVFGTVRSR